jgi:hypothetical protein
MTDPITDARLCTGINLFIATPSLFSDAEAAED